MSAAGCRCSSTAGDSASLLREQGGLLCERRLFHRGGIRLLPRRAEALRGEAVAPSLQSESVSSVRPVPAIVPSAVIADVVVIEPDVHGDRRGRFVETYRRSWLGLGREMIQANLSEKQAGAVVGLHYHLRQADYWYVLRGRARVVLHDLRLGSRTDGATQVLDLDGDVDRGLFIPPGVAHGFASLTEVLLWYLVDAYYDPADELGVAWDDPDIGADWGVSDPVLSDRDRANPVRSAIGPAFRPSFGLRR